MRTVIFANGEINDLEGVKDILRHDDFILAADGGADYCRELSLTPEVLIGDFDSIRELDIQTWQDAGVEVIMHDPDKDENDLELTLLYAQENGADEVLILGGLGGRWDQSIANILLPANKKLSGLDISYWEDGTWIYLITDEKRLQGEADQTVSLIPLYGDAKGVSTQGLAWALNDETLYFGATRGISNRMIEKEAVVMVSEGKLLCIVSEQESVD